MTEAENTAGDTNSTLSIIICFCFCVSLYVCYAGWLLSAVPQIMRRHSGAAISAQISANKNLQRVLMWIFLCNNINNPPNIHTERQFTWNLLCFICRCVCNSTYISNQNGSRLYFIGDRRYSTSLYERSNRLRHFWQP